MADALDDGENRLAALLAYRVTKDAAEQPDILVQRQVFVFAPVVAPWIPFSAFSANASPSLQDPCSIDPGHEYAIQGHREVALLGLHPTAPWGQP